MSTEGIGGPVEVQADNCMRAGPYSLSAGAINVSAGDIITCIAAAYAEYFQYEIKVTETAQTTSYVYYTMCDN